MAILDEQGRIFGLINVIDAFVLLFAAVLVVAGVAVVLSYNAGPSDSPTITNTSVAVDLGVQPAYLAERIQPGDTYAPAENSRLTVEDTYVAPERNAYRVIVFAEVSGPTADGVFRYAGAPLRLGRTLAIQTDDYEVSGTVLDAEGRTIREATGILLEARVNATIASEIDRGDVHEVAGRDVARVEFVDVYATEEPDQRLVLVGLSLATVDLGDGPQFGGTRLREGTNLPFYGDDYVIPGRIRRVDATEPRGEPATRTVTLEVERASPSVADVLRAGLTETAGGKTVARITEVERSPSELVVTGQDGAVHVRDHPFLVDLTLTGELSVRESGDRTTFKGRPLQRGQTVVLDLGVVTIEAEVVSL